jgi:hypothetical protein
LQDTHCGTIGARCCSGCAKAVLLLPVVSRWLPRPHPYVCAATPAPSYATQAHGAKNSTVANRRSNSCAQMLLAYQSRVADASSPLPCHANFHFHCRALPPLNSSSHALSSSGVKRIWAGSRFRAWTLGTRLWRTAALQCCCESPFP